MDAIEQLIAAHAAALTADKQARAAQSAAWRATSIANSAAAIKHFCGENWPMLEPWTTFDESEVRGFSNDAVTAIVTPPAAARLAPMKIKVWPLKSKSSTVTKAPSDWGGAVYANREGFSADKWNLAFYAARCEWEAEQERKEKQDRAAASVC